MAGRPSLRIGDHGKIRRVKLGNGTWVAICRYRDRDGVTRLVQRNGPPDEHDHYGKLAFDALKEALAVRRLAHRHGRDRCEHARFCSRQRTPVTPGGRRSRGADSG
jgi:hypothetical protein